MRRNLARLFGVMSFLLLAAVMTPAGAAGTAAAAMPQAVIVQGRDAGTAAAAVQAVGGTVTHELALINAVGAQVSVAQQAALAGRDGITRVYADGAVAVASGSTQTVRDEFSAQTYGNNDGTNTWTGDWIETNDSNGATGGDVLVTSQQRLRTRRPDRSLSRSVYLPTGSTATLTFDYMRSAFLNNSQFVLVEVSANGGGTWSEVGRLAGPGSDTNYLNATYNISGFVSPNTTIRFRNSSAMTSTSMLFLDNVQVAYTTNVIATELVKTIADDFGVLSYENNSGTAVWAGPWQEGGDDGSPTTGYVFVQTRNQVWIGQNARTLQRAANLTGANWARLRFDYSRTALDSGDYVALQISANGGASWTELDRFAGPQNDSGFVTTSYDITPYAAANTMIRFVTAPSGMNNNDRVHLDNIEISYGFTPDTNYPTLIGADRLHTQGIDGSGITVAVLDSGYWSHPSLDKGRTGQSRVLAQYNAITNQLEPVGTQTDGSGHGVHVTSMILNSKANNTGKVQGIAPNARLVTVKAFDASGRGSYADVIRGIDWIVANKNTYNIRVLNLSLSATAQSFYWDDPLNQAVMRAWKAGIVVVAAAGNTGPNPMTIGVPGNLPYVITVGAMSDNYTPQNGSDDILASFSSTGPTVEGFVKPEIVAPGGHMMGLMPLNADLALRFPQYQDGASYFTMSGTSQATAVTTGIVALMLQANPNLTPNDVKCRLMASARPAVNPNGSLAYSIFQQGAGLANAFDAVNSTATGCANLGLDINADLAGTTHFMGMANRDASGNYTIVGQNGFAWSGSFASRAVAWNSVAWNSVAWNSVAWNSVAWNSVAWNSVAWNSAFAWSGSVAWGASTASINTWVPQE